MFFHQVILSASIRMLGLTFHVTCVVYGSCKPANAVADAFTRIGSTGRTAISIVDRLSLPALAQADTALAAAIRPAAFGLLELTDAVFVAPLPFATLSLRGVATPRWVDLEPRIMHAWALTPSFRVGVASSLRFTSAAGFTVHVEVLADIHAVAVLDSVWTASCLVVNAVRLGSPVESPLPGPRIHAALSRAIDGYVASVDVALVSGADLSLTFEAADVRSQFLQWRASFSTSPFALCVAAAIPLHGTITLISEITHIEHLGFRTMLGLEFVP